MIALRHYFPRLGEWFEAVPDFRQPGKTLFPGDFLCHLALWQRISGIESNNRFESELRQSENLLPNLKAYLGRELTELPGIDTICYFMRGLSPEHSQKIIDKMIFALNRKKKKGFEDDTDKTTLLKLFRSFKRIFEKIKLDLFEKIMTLYEFKDLRIRARIPHSQIPTSPELNIHPFFHSELLVSLAIDG